MSLSATEVREVVAANPMLSDIDQLISSLEDEIEKLTERADYWQDQCTQNEATIDVLVRERDEQHKATKNIAYNLNYIDSRLTWLQQEVEGALENDVEYADDTVREDLERWKGYIEDIASALHDAKMQAGA